MQGSRTHAMPNESISVSKLKQLIGLQTSNLRVRELARALGLEVRNRTLGWWPLLANRGHNWCPSCKSGTDATSATSKAAAPLWRLRPPTLSSRLKHQVSFAREDRVAGQANSGCNRRSTRSRR